MNESIISLKSGGTLMVGLCFLILFVFMQLKSVDPFLNLRVFHHRTFRTAVLISITMYLISMGSGSILPLYVQSALGNSATTYALITLPGALIMGFVTVFSGKIYDKIGAKILVLSGGVMLLLGSGAGMFFSKNSSLFYIGVVSCIISTGAGFLNTPATTMALSNLKGRDRVDGSSILNTLRQISSSMATTLAVLVYSGISARLDILTGIKATYIYFGAVSFVTIIIAVKSFINAGKA